MSSADQVAALVAQFPLMQVDATPFDKVTNLANGPSSPNMDPGNGTESSSDDAIHSAAAKVKRQLMWQTAVSAVLAQIRLVDSYQVKRLQSVSSNAAEGDESAGADDADHNPDSSGTRRRKSSVRKSDASQSRSSRRRSSARKSMESGITVSRHTTETVQSDGDAGPEPEAVSERPRRKSLADDGLAPTAGFLIECSPLFESFKSAGFCSSVSSSLKRRSVAAGEEVVTTGSPSQYELLFLASGKCYNNRSKASCGTGDVFGGVFGDSGTYADSYIASTPCVLWGITRSRFLQILRSDGNAVVQEAWSSAVRAHFTSYFTKKYPIAKHVHRVPIYRCMRDVPAAKYVDDFVPEVRLEGDVLLSEGTKPTCVYCLVEGDVLRSQSGVIADSATPDALASVPDAAVQRYGTGGNSLHDLGRRFMLLGEEALILPGKQSYTCTVASPVALVFRIDGKRFVEALLDDPRLYMDMRRKVAELHLSQLKLDPSALRAVPVLKSFTAEKLRALAATAIPRIVERSRSLCTPSQTLTEIMLVVHGSVTDPRNCSRKPRIYERPPLATIMGGSLTREDRDEDDSARREHSLNDSRRPVTATTRPLSSDGPRRPLSQSSPRSKRSERDFSPASTTTADGSSPPGGKGDRRTSSGSYIASLNRTGDEKYPPGAVMKVVSCSEESELNPPLPLNPVRSISFCLGGDWEGLLTDKWPEGWEATETVEMFVLPTYQVRTEYNHLPRTAQAEILSVVREMQRLQLGLAQVVVSKLPPINSLLPFSKQGNARLESEANSADAKARSKNNSTMSKNANRTVTSAAGSHRGRGFHNADTQSQANRSGNSRSRSDKTRVRGGSASISAHPDGSGQNPIRSTDTIQQPFASFPIQTDQFALDSEPSSPTSTTSFADHGAAPTDDDADPTRIESRVTWQNTKTQLTKQTSGNARLTHEKKGGTSSSSRHAQPTSDKNSAKDRSTPGNANLPAPRTAADTKSRDKDNSSAGTHAGSSTRKQKTYLDSKADRSFHGNSSSMYHTKQQQMQSASMSACRVGTAADVPPLKSVAALGYLRQARELSQQNAGSSTTMAARRHASAPATMEEQGLPSWSSKALPPLESPAPSHAWPQSTTASGQRERQWFQLVPMKAPMPGTTLTMDM